MLNVFPDYRAALMYIDLHTYLAGMLKTSTHRRDTRGFGGERIDDFNRICPDAKLDLDSTEDWQLMAIGWMASLHDQLHAIRRHPDKTIHINFDTWLQDPVQYTLDITQVLKIDATREQMMQAWSVCQGQYSKSPSEPYSPATRRHSLDKSADLNKDLLDKILRWTHSLTKEYPALQSLENYFHNSN